MQKIWTENILVNWENISEKGHLSLHSLSLFLVRAAINHAEHLDFGFSTTSQERESWVLFRLNIKIKSLPKLNENIRVVTWPGKITGITASRGFEMYGSDSSEKLCVASSDWLVINLDTRKPQRLEKYFKSEFLNPDKIALDEVPAKFNYRGNFQELFKIRTFYTDLDMNGHVIAHNYFKWLQDAAAINHYNKTPSFIQMNYINECKRDEIISIKIAKEDGMSYMGFNETSNKVAFTAGVVFGLDD